MIPPPIDHAYGYAPTVEVGVLGPVVVLDNGDPLMVGGPKQRTVLAMLVAGHGSDVGVETLVMGVYGDDAPTRSKRTIHTYISNLRQQLGSTISTHGEAYRLDLPAEKVDAIVFERRFQAARDLTGTDPETAADQLRGALSMWRGHPYADVIANPMLTAEAQRLQEVRLGA
ncbi:MAG: BTAD domain-containing putative transcriptional regulator, partial [Acidimicrobiia bacterium]|nr:BTAD domain-containing putative transcriptional regulator [Acidimicrobiia bacterium]